jgi:hypothetical protein
MAQGLGGIAIKGSLIVASEDRLQQQLAVATFVLIHQVVGLL